ncbi:MAG: hypothetical protein J7L95_07910 [Prolixibacteraceae bacterium]|nr:hypothetical protein [Prolixibacteraceae bacterium]
MQHYIEQLVGDIRRASWNLKPPREVWSDANLNDKGEMEDMSYVEQYIYGEKEPVSQFTGIEQHELPPPEKLTEKEQATLAVELERMLQNFHFHLDFPSGFPAALRYPFIRKFWDEEHVVLSFGESHIEFCEYEEENCPFPGYCNICNEIKEQEKFDQEQLRKNKGLEGMDDDELPF